MRSGEFPAPKDGALDGITQFDVYDQFSRERFDFGDEGYLEYYADSSVIYADEGRKSHRFMQLNVRTGRFWTDNGNGIEKNAGFKSEILGAATLSGIDLGAIPSGYPEVEEILARQVSITERIEVEELPDAAKKGAWLMLKTTEHPPIGQIDTYNLFKLNNVDEGVSGLGNDSWFIHSQALGANLPSYGTPPYSLSVLEERPDRGKQWDMRTNEINTRGFYEGKLLIVQDRRQWGTSIYPSDVSFYGISDEAAGTMMRLRQPEVESISGQVYERENNVLMTALQGLQYARWSKWELLEGEQRDICSRGDDVPEWKKEAHAEFMNRIISMDYENYVAALSSLVDRFGEEFFVKVSWDVMTKHLQKLHTADMTAGLPFKAHADAPPYGKPWMDTARQITGGVHYLPGSMGESGYVVNAMALYGDVEFWKVMHPKYPEIYTELSSRFAELPEDLECKGTYGTSTVNPRALLKDHFPEAYNFLESNSASIKPRTNAPAIRFHSR